MAALLGWFEGGGLIEFVWICLGEERIMMVGPELLAAAPPLLPFFLLIEIIYCLCIKYCWYWVVFLISVVEPLLVFCRARHCSHGPSLMTLLLGFYECCGDTLYF